MEHDFESAARKNHFWKFSHCLSGQCDYTGKGHFWICGFHYQWTCRQPRIWLSKLKVAFFSLPCSEQQKHTKRVHCSKSNQHVDLFLKSSAALTTCTSRSMHRTSKWNYDELNRSPIFFPAKVHLRCQWNWHNYSAAIFWLRNNQWYYCQMSSAGILYFNKACFLRCSKLISCRSTLPKAHDQISNTIYTVLS